MRKSSAFFLAVSLGVALLAAAAGHARISRLQDGPAGERRAALSRQLQLTDLVLFTEARYTRHPTMADRHAPFQDHPMSLEHFPSGALLAPSVPVARSHEPNR